MWTLQEVVLPSTVSISWGSLAIDWKVIEDATSKAPVPHFFNLQWYHVTNFAAVVGAILDTKRNGLKDPMQALQTWRYRDATDPRDKIYSIVGLSRSSSFPGVPFCDYGLETATLFRHVTLDLILSRNNLAPLVGQRGEPHEIPGLPSWCLDFVPHSDPYQRRVRFQTSWGRYNWCRANGDRRLQWSSRNNWCYGPVLHLDALYVDTIKIVGKVLEAHSDRRSNTLDNSPKACRSTIDSWEQLVRANRPDANGEDYPRVDGHNQETWPTAFCRTLLGDIIWNNGPVRRFKLDDMKLVEAYRESGKVNEAEPSIADMVEKRGFFITSQGYFGIGAPTVVPGDQVWILEGGQVPFILKPKAVESDSKTFSFVSDAYVHGFMYGDFARVNGEKWETVSIH